MVKETAMHGSTPTDGFTSLPNGMVNLPDLIPVFPLPEVVLLPGEVLPLHIFEPRYRAMVRDALGGHRVIGMVEIDVDSDAPSTAVPTICDIGCVGFIAEHQELPDGRFLIWLLGLERFTIDEEIRADTLYRQARVTYTPIHESAQALAGLQPVRNELRIFLPRLVELDDDDDRGTFAEQIGEVSDSQLIALACQILELQGERKRRLLEADNQVDRFMLVYEELYRHLDSNPGADVDRPEDPN
jgi:Lon protease-like protein